jgi:hypothetical protein
MEYLIIVNFSWMIHHGQRGGGLTTTWFVDPTPNNEKNQDRGDVVMKERTSESRPSDQQNKNQVNTEILFQGKRRNRLDSIELLD